ncbi:MAG: cation transporter, partial [Desulfobacterales bacterium]|nr:cation transporter [Desulfobacterales bacterium]
EKCLQCSQRVALIAIGMNLTLVILKIVVGITSGSKGCIADGLHSASNIITAFAIMLSQKIVSKNNEERFHFGYGKIEFLAAGFTALFILTIAVLILVVSIKHLFHEPSTTPHFTAILISIISIGSNEMLFRYMRCVGTRIKSQVILANAWANRADCFSSVAVLIGVIGANLGFHHLDPIAAMCVVVIIIKVSTSILLESVRSLMDHSMNKLYAEQLSDLILAIDGVAGITELKTRQMGQKIWAEVDIWLDQHLTIQQGEEIASHVKQHLLAHIVDIEKVIVNFAPKEIPECLGCQAVVDVG